MERGGAPEERSEPAGTPPALVLEPGYMNSTPWPLHPSTQAQRGHGSVMGKHRPPAASPERTSLLRPGEETRRQSQFPALGLSPTSCVVFS